MTVSFPYPLVISLPGVLSKIHRFFQLHYIIVRYSSLADLGGGRAPPYGSRFFRFDMQNFRNIAALGVHGPPYEVHAPPTGNPGSATALLGNSLYAYCYRLEDDLDDPFFFVTLPG